MGKLLRATGAFFKGVAGTKESSNSQEIEFSIEQLKSKIASTRVNHILHLILSIITVGFWLIVWILVVIGSNSERSSYEKALKKEYQKKEALLKKEASTNINIQTDTTDKLVKLSELLEKELITKEEFEDQKAKLLN